MKKFDLIFYLVIFLFAYSLYGIWEIHKERHIELKPSKEDILIFTEYAFLNGYYSGLTKQDNDSVWIEVSKECKQYFKLEKNE
jgi:hypothetical protein